MSQWDDFKYFLALSRTGSLKMAAKSLGTDQATVGRRIYALEDRLHTKLFEKSASGFILTVAGEKIQATIEDIELGFESIERKIADQDERPEGVIRVAMPGALANHLVIPNMINFTNLYPKIEVQFLTGAEVLNLAKREADMAFRLVRPQQNDLVVRKVCELGLGLYGSKAIFKKHSKPKSIEDLSTFPFVGLFDRARSRAEAVMLSKIQKHLGPQVLTSSAWSSVYAALREGVGLGILPRFMVTRDSELEEIMIINFESSPLFFVIHPEVQKNKKFVLFSDYIIPILRAKV
jgi:DNA-binding transcriptional LysR family regulator